MMNEKSDLSVALERKCKSAMSTEVTYELRSPEIGGITTRVRADQFLALELL